MGDGGVGYVEGVDFWGSGAGQTVDVWGVWKTGN